MEEDYYDYLFEQELRRHDQEFQTARNSTTSAIIPFVLDF